MKTIIIPDDIHQQVHCSGDIKLIGFVFDIGNEGSLYIDTGANILTIDTKADISFYIEQCYVGRESQWHTGA